MIIVSACLLGAKCRYDGSGNMCEDLSEKLQDEQILLVCPEVIGGLTTPRNPCEIVNGRIVDQEGVDRTFAFNKGSEAVCYFAKVFDVKKAVLKSKSPSCGCGYIYDGSFQKQLREGNGVCAQALMDMGVVVYDEKTFIGKGFHKK